MDSSRSLRRLFKQKKLYFWRPRELWEKKAKIFLVSKDMLPILKLSWKKIKQNYGLLHYVRMYVDKE